MLTIVTVAVPIVLVAIIAAIWWVVRDPTPPPRPPGCHRRRRDPHDPIRGDDGNRQSSTTSSCRHGTARGAEEVSAPLALPSRQWARAWVDGARQYWALVIDDYRGRVTDYYHERYQDNPDAFWLMKPAHVVVAVCFIHIWVFAAPAPKDEVSVLGLWEHPILSELDLTYAPNWAEHARAAAGVSSEYQLIWEEHELPGALDRHQDEGFQDPFRNARNPFMSEMPGWRLADEHARAQEVQASLDGLRGRSLDRRTLRSLGDELTDLESWPVSKAQARGLAFESFMEKLLLAHGCDVHRGKHRDGEQIDLIVHRPFRALVECRWTRRPVGAPDIAALVTKLTRDRPAIVSGIYISMNGFTSQAAVEAQHHARERVVVLFDGDDIRRLVNGEQHIADLLDQRVDSLVRRFD